MGIPPPPLLLAVALVIVLAWALYRSAHPPLRRARVLAVDSSALVRGAGGTLGTTPRWRSVRYGLSGTPDELRCTAEGHLVPVEIKSSHSPAPGTNPPLSHRVQLEAYCLLLEEDSGSPPPYGILVYRDGSEHTVPWTPGARAEVLWWLDRVQLPYAGEASPSREKCPHCPYFSRCDAAAR